MMPQMNMNIFPRVSLLHVRLNVFGERQNVELSDRQTDRQAVARRKHTLFIKQIINDDCSIKLIEQQITNAQAKGQTRIGR